MIMPTRKTIPHKSGVYFITFTCYKWLCLIEKAKAYDTVYKWFDYLKSRGHYINGYVIMPNHIHLLVSFTETNQSINTIIGNGKRFMAYELIKRLLLAREFNLLNELASKVKTKSRLNKKLHVVWENSFDWKECRSIDFAIQKLDYIHKNPCSKRWELCNHPDDYMHSSACYYKTGKQGICQLTNILEMEDISLSQTLSG